VQDLTKECPMCADQMRPHIAVVVQRIPGTTQSVTRETPEWRCPECDYFEEIDDDELGK
jgi:hypothetical protein